MPVGYVSNLHITIDGDSSLAAPWVPFGKQLISELLRIGLPYLVRHSRVSDDVEVTAKIAGDQRYIHIKVTGCQPYLESGQVSTGDTSESDPTRFDPGTYFLGVLDDKDPLLGTITFKYPLAPAEQAKLVDGQEALSLSTGSREETGLWLQDQALLEKKKCCNGFRPSILSGKARLWLQSLYGAKHRRTSWDFSFAAGGEGLLWYKSQLPIGPSTGIFTSADYRYWLLHPAGGRLYSYKLKLSSCGQIARSFLRKHEPDLTADEIRKLEGVCLSHSSIDLTSAVDLGPIPTASPLGYGWHYSWSGAAMSVVHVATKNSGTSLSRYESTLHTCTIGVQGDRLILSAIVSTGPTEWQVPRGYLMVWYPNYSAGALEWLVDPAQTITLFNCEAPIYCFYEQEQLVQTIVRTAVKTGTTEITRTNRCPVTHAEFPDAFYPALNETPYAETRIYATGAESSAEVAQLSARASNASYTQAWSGVFENVYMPAPLDWIPANQNPHDPELQDECERTAENAASWEEYSAIAENWPYGSAIPSIYNAYDYWKTRSGQKSLTVTNSLFAFVAIPFYDSEVVYVGEAGSYREFGTETWQWLPSETVGSAMNQRYKVPVFENGRFTRLQELESSSPVRSEYSIGGIQYAVDRTTDVGTTIEVTTSKGAFGTEPFGSYTSLFTPSLSSPFSTHVFRTNISAGGCAMGDDIIDSCGFNFQTGPFVGWV